MKTRHTSLLLIPILLCAALPAFAQHAHEDHAGHAATATAVAIPAKRFATDAPLRDGMSRIHAALDALADYESGRMTQSMAIERVDAIKSATDSIFANCKLAPEADVALHGMLVPLLNGIQAFQKDSTDTATVAAMRQAVADYPRVFDDAGWTLKAGADKNPE